MYQTIKPPKHLAKYIDCFWTGTATSFSNKPNAFHAIANSKMELLFFCLGDYVTKDTNGQFNKVCKAGFFGHTTKNRHYIAATATTHIFGIRFLPQALLALFHIPANELTHQVITLNTLLGNEGDELEEKIRQAKTFAEKVNIIVSWFTRRLQSLPVKYHTTEKALLNIQQTKTIISFPGLVSQSCLSQRQFERNFKALAGFSPRTYLKLVRFERLVETVRLQKNLHEKRLTGIALDTGYYDQAHLNHHFREFTGMSPAAYFASDSTPGN